MSKRFLRRLVEEGRVSGWNDPRMPTLSGMRRRGYPPAALRRFATDVGVAKRENLIELARLESSVREELNRTALRRMAVLRPLRLVIENYPEGQVEDLPAVNNPEDDSAGTRKVPFTRELYIERDDFLEDPPKKFFRLAPGREVRLRYAYFVTCTGVVKDAAGEVVELRCRYDPATRGGDAPDGRKVKGTLHWVSATQSIPAEVRLYETLGQRRRSDGRARRRRLHVEPEPGIARDRARRAPRARARGRRARDARAVRAARLLLRRPGRHGRRAGLEPRGHAARHLGEGEPQRGLSRPD